MTEQQTTENACSLQGRVAVVTGAGSGIGRATTLMFLENGAQVVAADKNADTLRATQDIAVQRGWASQVASLAGDVTDEAHISALMDLAVSKFGQLDIAFNNAGAGGVFGPITELHADEWDRTFAILVRSVFLGIKHAARHMTKGGSIINTGSVAGMTGGGAPVCYSACKSAVIHLSRTAAQELGPKGIRINSISPGLIHTPLIADTISFEDRLLKLRQALKRSGIAEDIAKAALYLASDLSGFVTGTNQVVDGGITAEGLNLFEDAELMQAKASNMTFGNTGEEPVLRG